MFAQLYGSTTFGLQGILITVEVDISNGLPALDIVGLPDTAVRESKERVRAAIKNAGFEFPIRRVTVNLAPADLKKDSAGLDLPIALSILAASGQVPVDACAGKLFVGELSLEGRLRPVSGVLSMAMAAPGQGLTEIFTAPANAPEALLTGRLQVYAPAGLEQIVRHLRREELLPPVLETEEAKLLSSYSEDFAEVQGQAAAKRALEIAAAGGHNVLMVGAPGSGKTMLARRLTGILPPLTKREALEVTRIYSVAGLLPDCRLVEQRPFRSPHHTISAAGMIGGGTIPKPGEVTLSHNGVLFLDELPEFPRAVLEVLRQPLEDGEVHISRVNASLSYPGRFMLVASMNPCPCGYLDDPHHACVCSAGDVHRYKRKISGPLLDRIDLHVHVPRPEYGELTSTKAGEASESIAQRVLSARKIQEERLQSTGLVCNAQMAHRHVRRYCEMTDEAGRLLEQAFRRMNFSARSYDRVIKVARTVADLEKEEKIGVNHVAEAVGFRPQLA